MARKRGLGDAARDPLVAKETAAEASVDETGEEKKGAGTVLTAVVAAAVVVGFVGGWFARRLLRFF